VDDNGNYAINLSEQYRSGNQKALPSGGDPNMVSREVKVVLAILAVATLPLAWLTARWGMSLGVPVEAFWKHVPNMPDGNFGQLCVPAFMGGVLFIGLGLWGLISRDSEKQWHYSFALVCGGVIATGPVLGIAFQKEGLNPINWISNPAVFVPAMILLAFVVGCVLAFAAARDPYWSPNRRRRHLTIRH
jgi:hypothetical protein